MSVPAWLWLVAALVLAACELATATFVLMWLAVAALCTAAVALVLPLAVQVACFVLVSTASLFLTRRWARRWRQNRTAGPPPGVGESARQSLIGSRGVVVSAPEPGGLAAVRVRGELWSARSVQALRPGQVVRVLAVDSTVLSVVPEAES
ncbi:MAG: NfeD family protein [Alicyclobacillus sp.]|nr:NfeD family protein [Alicyclobacillus sp.]